MSEQELIEFIIQERINNSFAEVQRTKKESKE